MKKSLVKRKERLLSTRQGFGQGLLEAGKKYGYVWGVTADLAGSTGMNSFSKAFPSRFVQVGVAEQNLVTVSSGIASMNKVVFSSSFAVFSPGRNWEQIRTTIAYNNVPVIVVGSHAGLGVGEDGATHQALEDIALMRSLHNMIVIEPCDFEQARKAVLALAKLKKPGYLRVHRQNTPLITNKNDSFEIGKAQLLVKGKDVLIISSGPIISEALQVHDDLKKQGISVAVLNCHTIKPLDKKIIRMAKKFDFVITLEDHTISGGLGSAICELLSKEKIVIHMFGINGFGESGKPRELYEKHGLTSNHINKKIVALLNKKIVVKSKKKVSKNILIKKSLNKKNQNKNKIIIKKKKIVKRKIKK